MPLRVQIIVIASGIIVLAWLKNQNQNQKQKIVESARLTTCRFGTSVMFFTNANSLVSDENA